MVNILNKKQINFSWKLRVFFYQKTGKNLCIHLVKQYVKPQGQPRKKNYIFMKREWFLIALVPDKMYNLDINENIVYCLQ
jgi:hypothetical protein